jgi:hypothetical protein
MPRVPRNLRAQADGAAYANEQRRQHQWSPTSWVNTAASSITQIITPFPGVQALGTSLSYNRLLAGETSRFDTQSIAGVARAPWDMWRRIRSRCRSSF